MACGNPFESAFLPCPVEHRAKFHRPVAARTGQGRDSSLIALDQTFHDFAREVVARIDNVMGDAQLLADSCRIHQSFCATGAFAAHQPEREPFNLPACLHHQGSGERAVDSPGQAHRHAVLTRPGLQALRGLGTG